MGFFYEHFKMLIREGHQIELACSNAKPVRENVASLGLPLHTISFSRIPLSKGNLRAYKQLKKVIENGNYDIVHCHTPNASVITRLVCRRFRKEKGLKVFYTAHGFHFYKGAPKRNWMVFYPIEKFCSCFTDKLITINKEDFELAKRKFKAKEVHYVPGVGIDLSRFENVQVDRDAKRREIGVPEEAILLFSVGELNDNKNHQIVIRALAKLNNSNVHYAIAGVGDKKDYLLELANDLGMADQVHLLGYRKDIPELNHSADVFCFPSIREGLPVSLIEAMACGLPVVCSRIRGNTDLIQDQGGILFNPHCSKDCLQAIARIMSGNYTQMGAFNYACVQIYSIDQIVKTMKLIYER